MTASLHARVTCAACSAITALLVCPAQADLVLLDEYWATDIELHEVVFGEVDALEMGDATLAASGEVCALLVNATGAPSVRFRNAAGVTLERIPAGQTEGRLWYRTDAWAGTWRMEVWGYCDAVGGAPVKVLEGKLDGGGEEGVLVADDAWHQASCRLGQADGWNAMPHDQRLDTYVWLVPEAGWGLSHRTLVDRIEIVIVEGPLVGTEAPEPARRIRPRPGRQVSGPTWVWWEGEDCVDSDAEPGGPYVPDSVDEQALLSNGAWLHHVGPSLSARWEITLPTAGEYALWARCLGVPFEWRVAAGPWQACLFEPEGPNVAIDEVTLRWHGPNPLSALWTQLGVVELPAGPASLAIRKGEDVDPSFAMDCFLLTQNGFSPDGIRKPSEQK